MMIADIKFWVNKQNLLAKPLYPWIWLPANANKYSTYGIGYKYCIASMLVHSGDYYRFQTLLKRKKSV